MMKRYIKFVLPLIVLFLLGSQMVNAQHTYFPYEGKITYEKTMFLKNLLKRYSNYSVGQNMKTMFLESSKQVPENVVFKKSVTFKRDEMRYEHVNEDYSEVIKSLISMGMVESGMISYQNLKTKAFKSVFELGGQQVLIEDSITNIKWKITNEYRTIAGYNCRRANGLVMDSIYVVAFYTDEIPVYGGPSSFNGLPGMILGLAVPELHYNMFATKVDLTPVAYIDPTVTKKKGKPMNRKGVYDQIYALIGNSIGHSIYNLIIGAYYL